MRRLLLLFLLAGACSALRAQQDGFGLGLIIGEPTGVSFKTFVAERRAIDGALAWSFRHDGSFHLHVDHLWHNFDLIHPGKGRMPLYYGVGGRLTAPSNDDLNLGVRVPVGLAYMFDGAPVDVFLEIVPILELVPSSDVTFNAALGGRFYF